MNTSLRTAALLAALAPAFSAQWNPAAGSWGKTDPRDLRVMTWNVEDGICSTNAKQAGANNWTALARIVAAMKPDVLILQEMGDNDGNGTGTGVDSVSTLATTVNLFLHGGNDPFKAGNPAVTAYVQLYAPGYDLPHVFVSAEHDGFNRNVICSRYPFADKNGDGKSQLSDLPNVSPDLWAPGGDGGIRGFQHAEIDLPDASYAGDLVLGNSHLKAGGSTSDHDERVLAAKNIGYYADALFNGLGLGAPDPHAKIADVPPAASLLGTETTFVFGGDWNEDEGVSWPKGPAGWITKAQNADPVGGSGADGPDRNRTDLTRDTAVDLFNGSDNTVSGAKFDYLCWQDSLIAQRRSWLFNSGAVPAVAMPPAVSGFPGGAPATSNAASDHYPVMSDLLLMPPLGCNNALDLGFAKLGGNQKFPRATSCGLLFTGSTATLGLADAAPSSSAFALYSFQKSMLLVLGGTILPANFLLVGPLPTDATGSLALTLPGGGGPFNVFLQWGIVDLAASQGVSFSNALQVPFLP
jgi:hypothetical protein